MLLRFFLSCFLVLFCSTAYTCEKEQMTGYANLVGVDCDTMLKILSAVSTQVRLAQEDISTIADSKIPYSDKANIVQTTINRRFKSDNSIIQVTSLYDKTPRDFDIRTYLDNLSLLSKTKYQTVELTYYKESSKLGRVNRNKDNSFTFNIEAFQKFTGCKKDRYCYSDVTKKIFHALLIPKNGEINDYVVQIDGISATDTYSYNFFDDNIDMLIGQKK